MPGHGQGGLGPGYNNASCHCDVERRIMPGAGDVMRGEGGGLVPEAGVVVPRAGVGGGRGREPADKLSRGQRLCI